MKHPIGLLAVLALVAAGGAYQAASAEDAPAPAAAQPAHPSGKGVVRAVDVKARTIIIAHEPIASLNWPAMTMPFKVADPAVLDGVKVGAKIRFQLDGQTIVGITVL